MSDVTVEARAITVRRGGRSIVRDASLRLSPGERVVLMGPNGAGKSTLLAVLAGLLEPDRGEVFISGRVATPGSPTYRKTVSAALSAPLLCDGAVRYNVELPLRWHGLPAAERSTRADHWLEAFGVRALADRPVHGLSSGEARRVSLARAFALQSPVLLLDEPLSTVDAPSRKSLLADLDRRLRESGAAVLVVTHDREDAIALGGRLVVMVDGTIRQDAPVAEVFGSPADLEVARFVGVDNILLGTVTERADGVTVVAVGEATIRSTTPSVAGTSLAACVRPEDILLVRPGTALDGMSARNHLEMTVVGVEPTERHLRILLQAGGTRLVVFVTPAAAAELSLEPGARTVAVFKASSVHLV